MSLHGWVPFVGERVRVPVTEKGEQVWWSATVRTVAPPYCKVVYFRGGLAVVHPYRVDQIRPSTPGGA